MIDIRATLRDFIVTELLVVDVEPAFDDNLLAGGMIDSVSAMRLVAFIEETFDYAVPPQDLTVRNFGSINSLGAYLEPVVHGPG